MKINLDNVLRYAGIRNRKMLEASSTKILEKAQASALEMENILHPKTIWKVFAIEHRPNGVYLPEADVLLTGRLAAEMLEECSQIVVMAGTLGMLFEHRLEQKSAFQMVEALLWDACGSDYVEQVLDDLEQSIQKRLPAGQYLTDRFSCGYGDLPLSLQLEISRILNLPGIGIYLSDSGMMIPSKSVTAFMGISNKPQKARIKGCASCVMKENCTYRKHGTTCSLS